MELKERRSCCDRDDVVQGLLAPAKDRLMSGSLQKAVVNPGIGAAASGIAEPGVWNFDQKLCGRSRAIILLLCLAPVFKDTLHHGVLET